MIEGSVGKDPREYRSVPLPIWQELLVTVELSYLQFSPIWWGYGVPRGDGSAVVVVPGFMGTDHYFDQLRNWLERIGYRPYRSDIGLNAECPNLLIRYHMYQTVQRAWEETGRKVHLIGHSLGGMIARATACQMPERIESVITLGTPIRGIRAHSSVLRLAARIRERILLRHGAGVLPDCYTGRCTCDFLKSLLCNFPESVRQTSVYSLYDGIVDWKVCRTGDPEVDIQVSSTHLGMAFSPLVYSLIGRRLAGQ